MCVAKDALTDKQEQGELELLELDFSQPADSEHIAPTVQRLLTEAAELGRLTAGDQIEIEAALNKALRETVARSEGNGDGIIRIVATFDVSGGWSITVRQDTS